MAWTALVPLPCPAVDVWSMVGRGAQRGSVEALSLRAVLRLPMTLALGSTVASRVSLELG